MAAKTFNVEIDGYWRGSNKSGIPSHSGVYFVYECTNNKSNGSVTLHKLICIGESENVRDRISNHEKHDDWLKHVRVGNDLCYSTGAIKSADRERIEASYIFQHKPLENTEYKYNFPFDVTTVKSTGRTNLLNENFTVTLSSLL